MAPLGFSWIDKPRLAALAMPREREDFHWLRDEGIELLLSLTEERPRRDWVDDAGLLVFHVPVIDMEAPTQDQLDRCVSALRKAHARGMNVAVHCTAGLGRTGVILAVYLVVQGNSAGHAIEQVRRLRPGSIETPDQEEAVQTFARRQRQAVPGERK